MNNVESYLDISLELKEANTSLYQKAIQKLYKTIKEIDSTALIICYQPDKGENEVTEKNDSEVAIQVKNVLINFSEAILNYLWQIQHYFPNRRPNRKRIFSKFCLTYNVDIGDIILILYKALEEYKFYSKI